MLGHVSDDVILIWQESSDNLFANRKVDMSIEVHG